MPKEIFRKISIERLSSPERLDELLEVTSPHHWVALLALFGVVSAGVIWGFQGSTVTKVPGQGVVIRTGGVFNVLTMAAGRVTEIKVGIGDVVDPNQVVAQVAQPAMLEKIKNARAEIIETKAARDRMALSLLENDKYKNNVAVKQQNSLEQEIRDTEDQMKLVEEQIPVDKQLLDRGLITKQSAIATEQKLVSLKGNISKLRAQIAQIEAQQVAGKHESAQTTLQNQNKIGEMERNLAILEGDLERAANVYSTNAGRVVEVKVYRGAVVGAGAPIIAIEPTVNHLEAVVYVSSTQAKEVRTGMDVEVTPSGVQREEYGFMLGKVTFVSAFPATLEAIQRNFENEELARNMLAGGPVNELRISFTVDPKHDNDFKWSSPKVPPTAISSGSVCTVEVITRSQPPVALVIPYLKKKFGLS